MRACRIINIKVGRVGGFSEAIAVHDVAQRFGIPVWCGGMLESGIGRSHNVALSTLAKFQASGRCVGVEDAIGRKTSSSRKSKFQQRGTIVIGDKPGRGYDLRLPLIEELTVKKATLQG